ncbi:peptide ABC transporter ATP-binding protein [Rhizocola hellebori]|uniref:Peptide ABC transporter ATP-binding protein n=1 Tax=Rhizocola hellebori TaxID=1392758 RepID=A0A8J3VDE0_9ACTN|nr:dipeptide/oligopeptide/nickel ABC transporter permease/ATP-binding protein [Rhizocola hellebori]GIH02367.1 peptide ABC transporter ATP-binding protein [Rhizocola hellebori]
MSRVFRSPVGVSAAALLAAVLLLAVFAPVLWADRAATIDTTQILQGQSAQHWAGTDSLGRDIFFRVLVATRLSVQLAIMATAVGVLIGLLLGAAPLLIGARAGRWVTAAVNIAVAFPGLLLALFFAVIFGVGMRGAVLAIGFAVAPSFARLTHTLVSTVADRDYVHAARIAGVGRLRVLARHVLPNVGEPLVVNATVAAGGALLAFAGLSFLGLGVQAPQYDWGRLLGEGLNGIYVHPLAALAPGIAVVVAGLAFSLFGEAAARAIGLRTVLSREPAATSQPEPAQPMSAADVVLAVERLRISFGPVSPVRDVGFTVGRGESVGIVGESGSGKSLTALAIAQLIEEPGRVSADRIEFLGQDLRSAKEHRRLLGLSLAMVFQDPMTSLNPTHRVGRQLAEVAEQHQGLGRAQALARAVDRLRAVHLTEPERRARQYPHELSGGMRQRAMIGMGLMGSPALIIADEPTTALDVTVQAQVLALLQEIRASDGVALMLISHDISVVRQVCDRVLVMYAGRIVEDLRTADLAAARHPYTRALLAAVPDLDTDRGKPLTVIPGRAADPAQLPPGCAFAPRCPLADSACVASDPPLAVDPGGHRVACWHADREVSR